MAATKKKTTNKTTKSSTGSKQKSSTRSSSAKKKTNNNQQQSTNYVFWSVTLFVLGAIILLSAIIKGESDSLWFEIHNFLLGTFGASVYILPIVLVYSAVMFGYHKSNKAVVGKLFQGLGLIMIVSAFIQIVFFGVPSGENFWDKINALYVQGMIYKSGGAISAVLAWPLLELFKKTGATIIISLLLFAFVLLVANLTIVDFFKMFAKPIKKVKEAIETTQEEDFTLPPISTTSPKDKKKKSNFDFNMPVGVPTPKKEQTEEEKKVQKKSDKLEEAMKDLDEIIKNATPTRIAKPSPDQVPGQTEMVTPKVAEKSANVPAATENLPPKKSEIPQESTEQIAEDIENEINEVNQKAEVEKREYKLPPVELLNEPKGSVNTDALQKEMKLKADTLVETLKSFGVQTRIVGINRGPTVTRYELQPAVGVKISKITGLADDIALSLAATGVRIEAPIPGKAAVGIEIPNEKRDMVTMRELIESDEFKNHKSKISFVVGRNIEGNIVTGDIAKMPHMLIAGTTGSGKSVFTNSIIVSILYHATPEEVRIILIDPKMVEFNKYNGIPHLLIPVILDPRKAAGALNWAVSEMTKRYKLFAENNVRDLEDYNETAKETGAFDPLPQIVIIIDELADLMMAAPNEVEDSICRLAQLARAAGMHVIIATQRPSVDVVTGLIKANFPSRVALTVSSQFDSRTIIDSSGAEKLLGNGDMLYYPSGVPKPVRVQGAFVTNKEIQSIISYIKDEVKAEYDEKIIKEIENNTPVENGAGGSKSSDGAMGSGDEMVENAIEIIVESGQASTSYLQRRLKLGYARAARIIDEIEAMGIIGPFEGSKPRQVLMSKEQWYERKLQQNNEEN